MKKMFNILFYVLLSAFLFIEFQCYFSNVKVVMESGALAVTKSVMGTVEINYYRVLSLICAILYLLWIKKNNHKTICYLLSALVYIVIPLYLTNYVSYFQNTNEQFTQMRARVLILLFFPSVLTLIVSWVLEFIPKKDRYIKICWIVVYLGIFAFQLFWILRSYSWATEIGAKFISLFTLNYRFVEVVFFENALLMALSYALNLKLDNFLYKLVILICVCSSMIILAVFVSGLQYDLQSILIELIVCQMPIMLSLIGSVLVSQIKTNG